MNAEPTLYEPTWQVYTNDRIYVGGHMVRAQWAWVAYGPRGSQSGVEERAEDAVYKAQSAMVVLADPKDWRKAQSNAA